jgi:hypothetical protein
MRSECRIVFGKPEGNNQLRVHGKILLKWILNVLGGRV